jgi:phospholipid/cholesterol/gamma-HCH transport system substrate-binding protein
MEGVESLLIDSESDLRLMLASLRGATEALNNLLNGEQARLAETLQNLQAASASVNALTSGLSELATTQSDSIAVAISTLNRTLEKTDLTMQHLSATSAELELTLSRMNDGEGSLGRLLTDPGLYQRLDSTLIHVNSLMGDFQHNPGKYLRELRLIRVF